MQASNCMFSSRFSIPISLPPPKTASVHDHDHRSAERVFLSPGPGWAVPPARRWRGREEAILILPFPYPLSTYPPIHLGELQTVRSNFYYWHDCRLKDKGKALPNYLAAHPDETNAAHHNGFPLSSLSSTSTSTSTHPRA
jgi:hypothetical protein